MPTMTTTTPHLPVIAPPASSPPMISVTSRLARRRASKSQKRPKIDPQPRPHRPSTSEPTPPSGNLSSSSLVLGYTLETSPPLDPTHNTTQDHGIPTIPMNISNSTVSHQPSPDDTLDIGHIRTSPALAPPFTHVDDTITAGDLSSFRPIEACITPYPGYQSYHDWLEAQFPSIIPTGTGTFLHHFPFDSDNAVFTFFGQTGARFCHILGAQQYDSLRSTFAEIKTILDYVLEQDPDDPYYPYLDFLEFRAVMKASNMSLYPASRLLLTDLPDLVESHRTPSPSPTLPRHPTPRLNSTPMPVA